MDWASFLLITYAFLLALVVAAIVIRGINSSKSRYQKLLEEKEVKLSSIQLELEQTMETLGDQAAAMELAIKESERREKEASSALQQRLMEVQGAMVSAQTRLLRLEQGMEEMRRRAPMGIEIPAEAPPAALPAKEAQGMIEDEEPHRKNRKKSKSRKEREQEKSEQQVMDTEPQEEAAQPIPEEGPAVEPITPAVPPETPAEPPMTAPPEPPLQQADEQDIRSVLIGVFERGGTVIDASRVAGCSSVEASMIYNQWKRGFFS